MTSPEEQRRRPHPQRGGAVERKAKSQEPGDEVAVPMPENGPPPPVSRFPSRDSDSRARYPSRTEFYSLLPGLRCGPVVKDAIALGEYVIKLLELCVNVKLAENKGVQFVDKAGHNIYFKCIIYLPPPRPFINRVV